MACPTGGVWERALMFTRSGPDYDLVGIEDASAYAERLRQSCSARVCAAIALSLPTAFKSDATTPNGDLAMGARESGSAQAVLHVLRSDCQQISAQPSERNASWMSLQEP